MSRSKRIQIPMAPDEYDHLRRLAERNGISIAKLIRKAVAERYFVSAGMERKQKALAGLFSLQPIPVGDWGIMKKELSDRHGAQLSTPPP